MQAAHCCVAFFTAASFSTSLAMSLLSVRMPASGPLPMASVNSCSIVVHLPIAVCSAWGRSAGSGGRGIGVDAQVAQRGAGRSPEAVLLRRGGAEVSPGPPGLRERQVRRSEADGERDVAGARIARGVQARLGEGVARLVRRQAVVVGLAERGVRGERHPGQRRLGRGGRLRPAHARRAHRDVRSLGRAGGARGQARAAADQQARPMQMRNRRSFQACRRAASGLVRAARSAG